MGYRLALELSDRIAAVAAVIANQPANSECPATPADPVSVLIMNGTADTTFMPFGGGQVAGNRGLVISALETRDLWRAILGTRAVPETTNFVDRDSTDGSTVVRELYRGGRKGTQVAFYRVDGGGHTVPSIEHPMPGFLQGVLGPQNRDVEAAREVWAFLERHGR